MSFTIYPSVNISIIKDNKILLSRRQNTGYMDGKLCIPGGHIEKDETPKQAAARELKEELGVDIITSDLEFLCVAARNTRPIEYVAYEFIIRDKEYQFKNTEPEKCTELIWADIKNLPDDLIEDFRIIINEGILGKNKYLEIGFRS